MHYSIYGQLKSSVFSIYRIFLWEQLRKTIPDAVFIGDGMGLMCISHHLRFFMMMAVMSELIRAAAAAMAAVVPMPPKLDP